MGTHGRERKSRVRHYTMVEQRELRRRAEAAIETLLALLDELDGDPDLESSLGVTMPGYEVDAELDTSDDEDGNDAEPDDSGIGDQDGLGEQFAGYLMTSGGYV